MRVMIVCLLITLAWTLVASNECRSPDVSNVGSEAGLAADVCAINDALGRSPPDYVTARAIYEVGRNSKSPTLKSIAEAQYSTKLWSSFSGFFGDGKWLNTAITAALDGAPPYTSDVKRVQVIKKTLQGGVLVQQMAYHLEEAINKASNGNKGGALTSWDKAMAVFYGSDVDCAVFGNGQSRGIEFATLRMGVGLANYLIAEEFGKGGKILQGNIQVSRLRSIMSEIIRNIYVIYIQSTLKYATLIDQAIESGQGFEKAQAEGFAYARAVLPAISRINGGGASAVQATFDLFGQPSESQAEAVAGALSSAFGGLGIKGNEVNSFDGSRKGAFQSPASTGCAGTNPFAGNVGVGNTDADK